jgi:tetratricopeptide (TPR) repeat protein
VVAGSIIPATQGYKLLGKVIDATTSKVIAEKEAKVTTKEYVLTATGELAASIRKALGDTTPELAQRAAAETFTAGSLEAAHSYAKAQELHTAGKWVDATPYYMRAIELDPNFGRAYSGLAVMYWNSGRREESEKYFQMALAKIDRMTDREKYRTRGSYYINKKNYPKAIEEFSSLVKEFPADSVGYANLALAYFYTRNFTKAIEESRRSIAIYPKTVFSRNNLALYALNAGDFETATREAQATLQLNPTHERAHLNLALAELARGHTEQAVEKYRKLQGLSARGASMAATGLADIALLEGRVADAVAELEKGIAADLASNSSGEAAKKLVTLANAQLALGHKAEAVKAADQAIAKSKEQTVLFRAGRVYLETGSDAKMHSVLNELNSRLEPEPRLYGKLLEGEARLRRGKALEALPLFEQAHNLSDSWLGRFDRGRAYLEAGYFAEASSEFEICLKRSGEALAVFPDDTANYYYFPPVYYYLGRAQEGLKSPGAADSYRKFLGMKGKADANRDPLIADARQRTAQ